MKVLGVNAAQGSLWLCLVGEAGPEDIDPAALNVHEGQAAGHGLVTFREECLRLLGRLAPDGVALLDPETSAQLKVSDMKTRFGMEAVLALSAEESGIECTRMSRAAVRSALDLGRKGSLREHVQSVFQKPVGKHWAGKRDIAALAAEALRKK